MNRVLLVPVAGSALPGWTFPGFEFDRASDQANAIERLREQPCDAAVLVVTQGQGEVRDLQQRLDDACGPDVVPMLLAVHSRHGLTDALFDEVAFDALLDLAWPEWLVERCLSMTINQVRMGRGAAAVQQQVLGAVRQEMTVLQDLSLRDEVTGLYNVRHFRALLLREHERCRRHQRPYAVVLFDLDHLREINNTHGHQLGTRAIARVGLALSSTTRQSDHAFRIGGDEFASVLVESDRGAAWQHAERICRILRGCSLTQVQPRVPLTVSAGTAVFPEDGATVEAVLASADAALYRAKAVGRDRVVGFDQLGSAESAPELASVAPSSDGCAQSAVGLDRRSIEKLPPFADHAADEQPP